MRLTRAGAGGFQAFAPPRPELESAAVTPTTVLAVFLPRARGLRPPRRRRDPRGARKPPAGVLAKRARPGRLGRDSSLSPRGADQLGRLGPVSRAHGRRRSGPP